MSEKEHNISKLGGGLVNVKFNYSYGLKIN